MLSMPTASRSFGWEWFEACVCNKMIAYLIMYKLLVMKQMFNDSVKIVCLTEYDCLYSNGVCLLKNEVPLNLSLRFFVGKISAFFVMHVEPHPARDIPHLLRSYPTRSRKFVRIYKDSNFVLNYIVQKVTVLYPTSDFSFFSKKY